MDDVKLSISDCLNEAMEDYAGKINKIMTRDPDDTAELACLYSGIGGIDACIKTLAANGHLSPENTQRLKDGIKHLYSLCTSV